MKKLFLVIGLSLPLLAQGTETDIEISKQEQRDNRASKVVKTFQDWDFRKYEAAHKRAHMKDGKDAVQNVHNVQNVHKCQEEKNQVNGLKIL